MTEYSQSGMRGHGPFPEGAEQSAPSDAQQPADTAVPPQAAVPPYPTSGAGPGYGPFQGGPDRPEGWTDPFGGKQEGWTDTPYGFSAPPGRRIEPSPPPERSRLVIGILGGLVAGLLLFGTGGYFAGRATAPKAANAPTRSGELGVFERNQVAVNAPDFAGSKLSPIAQGWLPYLSTCSRSGSPGGPKLNGGERVRVRCTLDGMSAIFVEYVSVAERDKARATVQGQVAGARALAPGVARPAEVTTPSRRTSGDYVEYAYRLTESGTTRTVSGLWWDDARTPVAGYLLAYWKDGLGEKWEPMRDLWSRYA
ncbi:hypothetical protein [Actinoplanes sp. M2I2]|uniref:hypothetical protein n=1 Tax=Actinoplanes sp. M2I2 TaxID=1734444 RepID=UPI00202205CB|nr:hypothetical protein [Actinoplanes sp. M2I2]